MNYQYQTMTRDQALEYSIKHFDCIIFKGYSAEAVSLSDSLLFVWMCKHMFSPEQCWHTDKRFEQLIIIVVEIVNCVLYYRVKGVMHLNVHVHKYFMWALVIGCTCTVHEQWKYRYFKEKRYLCLSNLSASVCTRAER